MKKVIESCILFKKIAPEEIEKMIQDARPVRFAKGEVIYSPESFQKSLGIIVRGEAAAKTRESVLLNEFQAGDCFGVCALFSDTEQYVTTILAKTDCEVWFITAQQMEKLIFSCPQLALNYICFLSDRIRFLNLRINNFTAPDAQEALLSYLRQRPDGRSEDVPISRLAKALNIGRTSLYRAAEQLEKCGMIRKQGRVIELAPKEK